VARPVGVVEKAGSDDGLARLAELVREHEAERVVVGKPLTMRGEAGSRPPRRSSSSHGFAKL
jgi:RNase H-fold protein (predicted Holliday junction resolvase)